MVPLVFGLVSSNPYICLLLDLWGSLSWSSEMGRISFWDLLVLFCASILIGVWFYLARTKTNHIVCHYPEAFWDLIEDFAIESLRLKNNREIITYFPANFHYLLHESEGQHSYFAHTSVRTAQSPSQLDCVLDTESVWASWNEIFDILEHPSWSKLTL